MSASNYPGLPEGWMSKPLKHAVEINPEILPESTPASEILQYVDIAALEGGSADLTPKEIRFDEAPSRARRVLRDGDAIVSMVRTYLRAIASFPRVDGNLIASTGFAVLRSNGVMLPRFAYWAVLAAPFIESVVSHSSGVSYPAISPTTLGDLPVAVPPADQQERIANFLDDKTARIDALIAEKERLANVLGESLSGAIELAVTAPVHALQFVAPLKRVVTGLITGPFGSALHSSDYVDGGTPVINPAHIQNGQLVPDSQVSIAVEKLEELSSYQMTTGQLVVGRRGEMGRCAVVEGAANGWLCGTGCLLVTPNPNKVVPQYLQLVVSSQRARDWLQLESVGSTMDNLNTDILGRLSGYFPSLKEQHMRCEQADSARGAHGNLLGHVQAHIARLREYRSSLISAAVTGQLDVSTFTKSVQ